VQDFCSPLRRKNRRIVELHNYFCNKKGGQKNKQVGCLFIAHPLIIKITIKMGQTFLSRAIISILKDKT